MIGYIIAFLVGCFVGWIAGIFIDGKIENLQDWWTYKYKNKD